jgi:carbamoyltransferase
MKVLGLSGFYHDSAACLVMDGRIAAAAQEERYTGRVHDKSFPLNAAKFCLQQHGLSLQDLDRIVFYDDPELKWNRIVDSFSASGYLGIKNSWRAITKWLSPDGPRRSVQIGVDLLAREFGGGSFDGTVEFVRHHHSHAASAFFPSPFSEAAVLVVDGVGEYATTSVWTGRGKDLKCIKEIKFPHSLGLLYSAFTYFLGFKVNSGEYKVMGLAPYGKPKYVDEVKRLIQLMPDGSFALDLRCFKYFAGDVPVSKEFEEIFGIKRRNPESRIKQVHCDVAHSLQVVLEQAMINICRGIRSDTGLENLCLAGGVALNCVATGKLIREEIFDNIWVQPASGDAGGALGAALLVHYRETNENREVVSEPEGDMAFAQLGDEFSTEQIRTFLDSMSIPYTEYSDEELFAAVAKKLAEKSVIGWFQGRMEFGPRALGNRSILADPRDTEMQSIVNLKVKFRESFRPFAPAVLAEKARDWFDLPTLSPYMLRVGKVNSDHWISVNNDCELEGVDQLKNPQSVVPAVTHVDKSARLQTVTERSNARFYRLISCFNDVSGCPILLNTSFNVRDEPIVRTPNDAYRCFMRTEIDTLVIGNFVIDKAAQPAFFAGEGSIYEMNNYKSTAILAD